MKIPAVLLLLATAALASHRKTSIINDIRKAHEARGETHRANTMRSRLGMPLLPENDWDLSGAAPTSPVRDDDGAEPVLPPKKAGKKRRRMQHGPPKKRTKPEDAVSVAGPPS